HLAGVIAAKTALPVLGVPMPSKYLQGLDSWLSIVQMPKGSPVATFAIGEAGGANAGRFAVAMLAQGGAKRAKLLAQFRASQAEAVKNAKLPGWHGLRPAFPCLRKSTRSNPFRFRVQWRYCHAAAW